MEVLMFLMTWAIPIVMATRFKQDDYTMVCLLAEEQRRETGTGLLLLLASFAGFITGLVGNSLIHALALSLDPFWEVDLDLQVLLIMILPFTLTFLAVLIGIRQQLHRLCPV